MPFNIDELNVGNKLGIGFTSHSQFPLHVGAVIANGWPSSRSISNTRIAYGWGGTHQSGINSVIMAYVRGEFAAKGNISSTNADYASDERIKENIVGLNASENLDIFRNIQLKTYNYIDKALRGHESTSGFIAQQIQQILPNAVRKTVSSIPNIYKVATVSGEGNNIITFTDFDTSNLLTGDNITGNIEIETYPTASYDIKTKIKTVIDQNTIEVEDDLSDYMGDVDDENNVLQGAKVYVYGQEINDLLRINKSKIFTITTGALQEVDRQLQAEKVKVATLEAKVATLESENIGLRADIEAIKAHLGLST